MIIIHKIDTLFHTKKTQLFRIGIFLILSLSLINNLLGIDSGLPYVNATDEPTWVNAAFKMVVNKDLNPHEFGHPGSTTIYLLAITYSLFFLGGTVLGKFPSIEDFILSFRSNPGPYYLSGRLISVIFSVMTVFLVILITNRIFNRRTALFSGLLLALSPLYVTYSKIIRTDIQATFFLLVSFWYCINILKENHIRDYILAGMFSGVATATKYPAILIVMVIISAHFLHHKHILRAFSRLVIASFSSLIGIFISSPFILLDLQTVMTFILRESRSQHLSQTGGGFFNNLFWYITNPLPSSITWIGFLLAIIGMFIALKQKHKKAGLVIFFFWTFIFFLSFLNLRWNRWIIPALPFLCMLTAYAFFELFNWLKSKWHSAFVFPLITVLFCTITFPLAYYDFIDGKSKAGTHTRIQISEWILNNIPPGSKLLMEANTAKLPVDRYQYYVVYDSGGLVQYKPKDSFERIFSPIGRLGRISDVGLIVEEKIEYIVMSNYYFRFKEEEETFPQIVYNYESIMRMGEIIFHVQAIPGQSSGPNIYIYQLP